MNRTRNALALVVTAVFLLMAVIPISVIAQQTDPCATEKAHIQSIVDHKSTLYLDGKPQGTDGTPARMLEKSFEHQEVFWFHYKYRSLAWYPDVEGYVESVIEGWYGPSAMMENCGFLGEWVENVMPVRAGEATSFTREGWGTFVYSPSSGQVEGVWYYADNVGEPEAWWIVVEEQDAPTATPHMTPTWTPAPLPLPTGTPYYLPQVSKGN